MTPIVADDPDDPFTEFTASFLEPSAEQMAQWGFPLMYPDESVVKMLRPGIMPTLAMLVQALAVSEEGYRVAVGWRHPLEIRKAFENDFDWSFRDKPHAGHKTHMTLPWCVEGKYEKAMTRMRDHYANRRDVHSVVEFQYRSNYRPDLPSLEHDALEIYERLAAEGWPLDPVKAASVIDVQAHCRWKAEEIAA